MPVRLYDGLRYISGGIYCMNQRAFWQQSPLGDGGMEFPVCAASSNIVVDAGLQLRAYPCSKVHRHRPCGGCEEKAELFFR